MCQYNGVTLISTLSPFKSLRCPECEFVHKKNRNKEVFKCTHCSYETDADFAASVNNSICLPYVDLWLYRDIAKKSGFFWSTNGIFITERDMKLGCSASPIPN